jgi:hypothetical protein
LALGGAEPPCDDVALILPDDGLVGEGLAAHIAAADARAIPHVDGEAAPEEDLLEALAAAPILLPHLDAGTVPEKQSGFPRADRDLIIDEAMVAMECGLARFAHHRSADGERAFARDHERRGRLAPRRAGPPPARSPRRP